VDMKMGKHLKYYSITSFERLRRINNLK
jgi:hypothetical protein